MNTIRQTLIAAITAMICITFIPQTYAQESQSLTEKQQAVIPIAAFTATGNMPKLETALAEGLDAGLTVNEVKEILVHAYAYAGFPRALNGINTFSTVLNKRKSQGITDDEGKAATPMPANLDKNAYGHKTRNALVGRDISDRPNGYAAFAPIIDEFLVEHLFADIFHRDVLSVQQRELVTVSMLAAMEGTEPQLEAHLGICLKQGLNKDALEDYVAVLEQKVNAESANRAASTLNEVLGISSAAEEPKSLKVIAKQEAIKGSADNFTGNVAVESRFAAEIPNGYRGGVVNFEAGARTAWHTHPLGQSLIVVSGRGLVQSEGEEIREIKPGDVVWIPANERHWHGAAHDSPMSHVAISTPANDATVRWMEHVSDEQYLEAKTEKTAEPLMIEKQESFAVGGTVITEDGTFDALNRSTAGQTFHGDHAYVFHQKPVNARKLPLVFWHGIGQSSKTWETTPDGREGFQNIFLRRRFPVYLIDQPRRGRAGRSTLPATITPTPDEQDWFGTFRVGIWPDFFPDVQFSRDPEALNQYFRQITPDTGPLDPALNAKAVTTLFEKIGSGVLVTHSHAGGMGWRVAVESPNVKSIVSYEPGSGFLFPEGEVPDAMPSAGGTLEAIGIPLSDFRALTEIPIVIYYGDNIPTEPVQNPGQDGWRVRLEMAELWRDTVNRHGGDVTVVHLPEIGIKGNTHFPMSDLNNIQVADEMSKFLSEKKLD